MKKLKILSILLLSVLSLSACKSVHTGKVVIDENKKSNDEKLNVEYIIVDEKDKDSLIKNIKKGKGAVIDKAKISANADESKEKSNDTNSSNNSNDSNR